MKVNVILTIDGDEGNCERERAIEILIDGKKVFECGKTNLKIWFFIELLTTA
jgi:hypothetical protein